MPAAGGETTEQSRSCRFIVEMKRLRIVLPGKSLDRRLVDQSLGLAAEFLSRLEIVKIKTAQGVFLLEDAGCATAAALITSCRQRPRHLLDQTSQGQQRRYHITAVIKPGQWSPRLVHARSSTDSIVKQPNPTLRHPNSVRSRVRRCLVLRIRRLSKKTEGARSAKCAGRPYGRTTGPWSPRDCSASTPP